MCYVHHYKKWEWKNGGDTFSIIEKYHEEISCDMNFDDAGWEVW